VPQYTLGYTGAHQLQTESSSASSYVWQPGANALVPFAAVNNLNQYPSWGGLGTSQSFSYDLKGNLTSGIVSGPPGASATIRRTGW